MILWQLFYTFFTIGAFTFGGGLAMLRIAQEQVLVHGWLEASQIVDFVALSESTPGPFAINMATYVGSVNGGLLGSVLATLGVVMPSFIIIILIASVLKNFTDNKYFKAFVTGVKPIIVALLITTGLTFLLGSVGLTLEGFTFKADYVSIVITAILLAVYFGYGKIAKKKLSTIPLILTSAALGIVVSLAFELVK